MSKVKVAAFSVSIDGYGAGPNQSLENPLGEGGMDLHRWFFDTTTFQRMTGEGTGGEGPDEEFAKRSFVNMGAWILGRNMFGPIRGPWLDEDWKGWWGDEPPYHVPVFVLTHHRRAPLEMKGGTTFYFVTGGIHQALDLAREAAAGKDVRIGGGVDTIRQYLEAALIDEIHLALAPILLGRGEHLLHGIDLARAGFRCKEHVATPHALHVVLDRE